MKETVHYNPEAIIVTKLALERCHRHISHLYALIYTFNISEDNVNAMVADSVYKLVDHMAEDLQQSQMALDGFT